MTSQNNTLRCAASIMYSMAGPNTPSDAANAPVEDRSAWFDGIVCSLLAPQPVREGHDGCRCALARARQRRPLVSDGLLSRARMNGMALRARKPFTSPRPDPSYLCQVPDNVRRSVRPYR